MRRLLSFCILLTATWGIASAQDLLPYPLDTINGKIYYRYTVERGIGLYRVSKNFNVTQEDIIQANPQIHDGLRFDEVILVPAKGLEITEQPTTKGNNLNKRSRKPRRVEVVKLEDVQPTQLNIAEILQGGQPTTEKNIQVEATFETQSEPLNSIFLPIEEDDFTMIGMDALAIDSLTIDTLETDTIRLAMLLPLQADATKRDKNVERFYDFYTGALIAIYEEQRYGQAIEVFVYDIGKTELRTQQILSDSLFPDVDAIIGPAYRQQMDIAAQFVQKDSTWLLIPFLSNVEQVNTNPYLLQFNPSSDIAADTLASYLAQQSDSINCVLIEYTPEDKIPSSIIALHNAIQKHNIPCTTTTIDNILNDNIDSSLVADKENIIIFNTDQYRKLEFIIPHLLRTGDTFYQITLYSQFSWQKEDIMLPQIYTSAFKNDYTEYETYEYLWKTFFGHELSSTSPRYDLLGYDLTKHMLKLIRQSEDKHSFSAESLQHEGIQSNINFQQQTNGGYVNQTMHILRK